MKIIYLLMMKLRLILARLRTGRVGIMFTIDLSQFLTPIFFEQSHLGIEGRKYPVFNYLASFRKIQII